MRKWQNTRKIQADIRMVMPFTHSLDWHQKISIDHGQGWKKIRKKQQNVNENSELVKLSVGRNLAQI